MANLIYTITELKKTIDALQDISAEYINTNLPINNMFNDQIEKVSNYNLKHLLLFI